MYSLISNIQIAGIAACVPKQTEAIQDLDFGTVRHRKNFIDLTGIEQRRIARPGQCTSDFCCTAANQLLDDLKWKRSDVDILILVTQTPDYLMPATAIVLQERLGLANSCMAFDINLGCSGFVMGLQVIASLLSLSRGKKALLLTGDTYPRPSLNGPNKMTLLFGACGTASALEWCENAPPIHAQCWSDGKDYRRLFTEFGAWRNPFTSKNCKIDEAGNLALDYGSRMDGHALFNFATSKVPIAIQSLLEKCQLDIDAIDYFVLHQANKMINEAIRKSLNISADKYPYSISKYGNTSSASVPLTLVSELRDKMKKDMTYRILASGFGVGLSWAVAVLPLRNTCIPEIIEI